MVWWWSSSKKNPIPVTVIGGFLGAGKSTMLEAALRERGKVGGRLGLIVNDVADLNVDANLLRGAKVVRAEDDLVELSDGCVCCNLGSNILEAVARVCSGKKPPVAVVVECSGVAETARMAELFRAAADLEAPIARLASIVTVVDSEAFPRLVRTNDDANEREDLGGAAAETSCRGVADLLMEQVETADVVILNKADRVSKEEMAVLKETVGALNKDAELLTAEFGKVPLRVVLPCDNSARDSRALARHTNKRKREEEGAGETDERRYKTRFRVLNTVFRNHSKPFHPKRFQALLNALESYMGAPMASDEEVKSTRTRFGALRSVLRSKGIVWIADAPTTAVRLACAGSRVELHGHEEWGKGGAGKPRHELVVIGQDLDGEAVTALLESALLTDSEYAEFEADPSAFGEKVAQRSAYWCGHEH